MPRVTYSKGMRNFTVSSQFDPALTSSPTDNGKTLSKKELECHLKEHESHMQTSVAEMKEVIRLHYYEEMLKELDEAVDKLLSEGFEDFPVDAEFFQEIKRIMKATEKDTSTEKDENDKENVDEEHTFAVPEVRPKRGRGKKNTSQRNNKIANETISKNTVGATRRTTRQNSQFQTPQRNENKCPIAYVTPGPGMNRPLSVLRRPVSGELAVSMNGSPLVTTHDSIRVPQVSIPLSNGRVLTYLANEGLDPDESIGGELSPETQDRLTVIYKILERKIKKT